MTIASTRRNLALSFLSVCLLIAQTPAIAQDTASATVLSDSGYQEPVKVLKDLVDAPRPPVFAVGPKRTMAYVAQVEGLPSIDVVAQPELKLAGLRIHPKFFAASRFTHTPGLALFDIASNKEIAIQGMPAKPNIASASWSPDQSKLAFSQVDTTSGSATLWIVDVATRTASEVPNVLLNRVTSQGFEWFGDSAQLLLTLRTGGEVRMPSAAVPNGPVIQNTIANAGVRQLRTYPDLLQNEDDASLFEYYLTTQLAIVDANGGNLRKVGAPDLNWSATVSPGGTEILSTVLRRPFSYSVPAYAFPQDIRVIDLKGNVVKELHKRPLIEGLPTGNDAVATGMRDVEWRNDAPNTLIWAEALDGGDPGTDVKERDVVKMQSAPFTDSPREVARLATRYAGITWGDGQLALLNEYWWKSRKVKQWRFAPDQLDAAHIVVREGSSEDSYNDPGDELLTTGPYGYGVLLRSTDGRNIYRIGTGASKEGNRPFLDRVNVQTREATRLFRSQAPYFERPLGLLDPDAKSILVSRQSTTVPANVYVMNTGKDEASYKVDRALTRNVDPFPNLSSVSKQLIHYTRKDGVKLSGTLYLPPGFAVGKSKPLPVLMWAYPAEFKSADAAGQVKGSPYTFNQISYWGPLPFLARGFAVLDNPAMPIIGEGTAEPNDTYLKQLVDNAEAAVNALADMKVGDRERMSIGGHSYGAFMTANLLAHSRLFKAGIARSGAYNRTLTPFGFQAEERNYWGAKDVYREMSPFNYAEKIKDRILFVHGADDNNPGTFPVQSERMFAAVKGLGGNARLVMLPNESHAYRARESILHMLAEEDAWLDQYVKNARPE